MNLEKLAKTVSERLRVERVRLNLSLEEVSAKSGVSTASISRYEQGKLPTVAALYLLAEAYALEAIDFMPLISAIGNEKKRVK